MIVCIPTASRTAMIMWKFVLWRWHAIVPTNSTTKKIILAIMPRFPICVKTVQVCQVRYIAQVSVNAMGGIAGERFRLERDDGTSFVGTA